MFVCEILLLGFSFYDGEHLISRLLHDPRGSEEPDILAELKLYVTPYVERVFAGQPGVRLLQLLGLEESEGRQRGGKWDGRVGDLALYKR